jgi:putative hydrolase of HD superfamily
MTDMPENIEVDEDLISELDLLFEAGYLKRLRRSGWLLSGLHDGESVAEHVFRTAVVGFVLACLEEADPYKVASLCLFHDIQETRVSDLNPLTKKYFDQESAESTARDELCEALSNRVSHNLGTLFAEYSGKASREAIIARDADLLECILQAYEYKEAGFRGADGFISGDSRLQLQLKSNSACRLARLAENRSPSEWWKTITK